MNRLLRNVIISVASSTATAYFLPTKEGKRFQKKAAKTYETYKENPAEYRQEARDKATGYTDLAVDTFNNCRQKFESGELTIGGFLGTVKEKGKTAADFASEKASEFTSKVFEVVNEAEEAKEETKTEVDDIITNYTQDEETPATEKPETTTEEADEK